jgi:hypothetical protein
LRFIRQIGLCAFAKKHIQRSKKRRKRFAGTGWRRNQDMPPGLDGRPTAQLRFCR